MTHSGSLALDPGSEVVAVTQPPHPPPKYVASLHFEGKQPNVFPADDEASILKTFLCGECLVISLSRDFE
jgi:hypothetical protein